jgi:ribosomal protein S15P/S13E
MTAAEQTSDDELCLHVPLGNKMALIGAALAKRALLIPSIKPAEKLELLERMNGMTDGYFSAAMLVMVEPLCDTGFAIFKEAASLDPLKDATHGAASFNLLTSPNVFAHFIKLNQSILAAIKHHAAARQERPAVPRPAETPPPRPPGAMGAAQFAHMQRRANGVTQHRSHHPSDQINRMGGGLPDFAYDNERDPT